MYEVSTPIMEQLKTFFTADGIEVADSRDIATAMGREHSYLLKSLKNYEIHAQNSTKVKSYFCDFFIESSYKGDNNKTLPNYYITKKGCEFLANKMTGQKGTEFTILYINAFHEMKERLTEKEKMQIALAQAIEECRDTVTIQEFAKFISSHNYNIGRNQLFEWLRTRGYLMSNPHHFNEPYQKYISAGYFKMTEKIVMQGNKPVIKRITLLTGKGQSYIGKKLINEHIRKMFKFKKLF